MKDKKRSTHKTQSKPQRSALNSQPSLLKSSTLPSSPVSIVGVDASGGGEDTAAQDRVAEELRKSDERFRNLADTAPAMLWITEPNGACSFLSRGWYEFTGQTEQEGLGQDGFGWLDAVHPEDREQAGRMFLEANKAHRPFSLDYRLRRHDGEYRWAIDAGHPRFGTNGEFLGYIGSVLDINDRKQAEQEKTLLIEDLNRSQQYFCALFNWTPSAVGISTVAEGRLCDVNEGFSRLTGYTREELIGRTTLELGLWADPSQREIVLRKIREQGFVHNREGLLRTKSGEIRSLMVTVESIQLGTTPCLIYLAHDITEHKRAENALRESEERFRSLVGVITDVPWTADPKGQFVTPQEAYSRYTGASWEELRGRGWAQYIHPDDREQLVRAWKHAVATRTKYEAACREWHGPTQQWRHVIARGTPVLNPDGSVREWVGSLTDVNEQYEAEAALRESEERYRFATRATHDVIWDWDMVKDEVVWGEAMHTVFGHPPEQSGVVIRHAFEWWTAHIHPDDRERVGHSFQHATDLGSKEWYEEYRFLRANGTYAEIEDAAFILYDAEDKPIRITGAMSDITERKKAEEALHKSEEKYRTIFNSIDEGFCIAEVLYADDRQAVGHRVIEANPAFEKHTGLKNPAGRLASELMPGVEQFWNDLYARVVATGERHQCERHSPAFDRWFEVEASRVGDESDRRVAIVFRDITERKQTEEHLRQRDELITLMLNTGPGCIKRVAVNGTVLSMNPTGLRLIDACNEQEVVGLCVFDLVTPEHRDAFIAMHRAVLAGQSRNLEFEILGLRGTRRWMQTYAVPLRNPITGCTEQLAVTHDVTERKRAAALLAAEKRVLELIVNETELPEVLDTLMRETEAQSTDGMLCSVLLSDETGQRLLHGAAPSLPEAYNAAAHGLVIGPSVGSCGTAAFERKPVFVTDIATDPLWTNAKDLAAAHGLGACHSTPILSSQGRLLGTIAMYYRRPHNPDAHDRQLIERATQLAGIAIERKRAEEALRLAKFSVDQASDAVYWIDPQAKVLAVNEAATRMLGYSKDELCAMTVHDLNPEFQADMWPGYWAETRKRGTMVIETYHKAKNGRLIPIEVSVNFLSYEGREYHCAFVRDITERKRADEALRHSEAFITSVVENLPNMIFVKEAKDLTFVRFNKAGEDLLGLSREALLGKSDYDCFPKEVADFFTETDRRVLEIGGLVDIPEEVIETRHQGLRVLHTKKIPIYHDTGEPRYLLGVSEDITERKRTEKQLRTTLDQVRTLSGRLATAQEEERTRIARELHDELGVKLTCLKIDLSRMMSFVGDHVRADLHAELNDRVGSMIEQVDGTIVAVQRLVTQLRPALLDNLGLVAAIEWQSQDFQQRTGIPCTCATNGDEIAIEPERATAALRICQEALTNTVRHAQATAVMIQLFSQHDFLQMTVTDNGVGIPDTKISDHRSLGLLGMQERAAQCGGTLAIQGDPDKGTTVTLYLPIGPWT